MLPIIGNDSEDIYITGDTHLDHGNIIKYMHRPFLSLADRMELTKNGGRWHDGSWKGPHEVKYEISQEGVDIMNSSIINAINKTVPRKAKLIHLGDFSIDPKDPANYPQYVKRCTEFREQINCQNICIIWGNHDLPEGLAQLFTWSGWKAKIELKALNTYMIFDHYFNAVYDMSHRGAFHCYGHSHSEIEPYMQQILPGIRAMDGGVDNAAKILGEYRPFSLKEVIDLLKDRPGFGFNPNTPRG